MQTSGFLGVAAFQRIPHQHVHVGDLASGHRAACAAAVFLQQIAAGHTAHGTLEAGAGELAHACHDPGRHGAFLFEVVDARDLFEHARQQRRSHWCAHRPNVILDPDRQRVGCARNARVEIVDLVGGGMFHIGWHGDDRIGERRTQPTHGDKTLLS